LPHSQADGAGDDGAADRQGRDDKLATALREQPTDKEAVGSLGGATLADTDRDGRKLFAEGLVAFAKGRYRDRARLLLSAPPRLATPARLLPRDTFDPRL